MATVSAARYGKDNVRLYKVHRDEKTGVQTVNETTVCVLLEGDIQSSYTRADNSVVVATDSVKNTIYLLAKQNPVTPPELFGSILATHFPAEYAHIHAVHVKIITHRWTRMVVDGKPHPHSFFRDGTETRNVEVYFKRNAGISIKSGIQGLTVLKSTGSAFHGFVRDEYTTLKEVSDRILSTDVDAAWDWKVFPDVAAVRAVIPAFDAAWEAARQITMDTFAKDFSASVQATMYKMSEQILAAVPLVEHVSYNLPNKHYFEIDMSWHKGLQNTGKNAEVYAPQSSPNGLIKCTVSRASLTPKSKL
ncbi:urate oxidase UaZ [Tricharina praecox]|uniref:urate oxidase UaZ n=1 Tax=Tricharina praecox TaxID=43433 RepID=UPI00221F3F4F|nr:urate oxidase UaZ [Tricharina praecox]KAI5843649.1 urate oxidase UaZ [Tricharina praecox]